MAILYSTTGTAPIELENRNDGTIGIYHEDGSGQIYSIQSVIAVLMNAGALPSRIHEVPC